MAGTKHDQNKLDLSIVPVALERASARALLAGAFKYGRNNYKQGIAYTRLIAACLRHLKAWNEEEHRDEETGLSHLDLAIANLAMLAHQEEHAGVYDEFDDRDLWRALDADTQTKEEG